jgi:single-strand DNA-binding protein|tara:strand:+ start:108 stop:587 length:480 start_codon:yes stop_codon:yes gene_type:complete
MSVNKVILVGRLGRDPEERYTANQQPICSFSVATSTRYKDKEGNSQEQTEWHNISMFGKLAEIGNQYLKKGSQVYLEGRLQTNKSEKDGQTRYFTQIVASQMTFLGTKDGGGSNSNDPGMNQTDPASSSEPTSSPASSSEPTSSPASSSFDEFKDDIPF